MGEKASHYRGLRFGLHPQPNINSKSIMEARLQLPPGWPQAHLTSKKHGGLMVQLFHFLGKQGVHLSLQGPYCPLAAVEDRARRQHGRRLQAAQTVTAAAVAEQQSFTRSKQF